MSLTLRDGSEAMADAAIAAGLRFYAGYPMAPSTDLLEHLARKLPDTDGVCINAETEISGINMAIGAAMTGFRAATGSCGQGLALMQEAIAETALHETPLVVFNVGRNQQDYFQATRGGGWGDYRTITFAPKDVQDAFHLTQLLFHLTDKYRVPGILYTDGMLARTQMGIEIAPLEFEPLPPKDWALDGTLTGTGRSRNYWTWALGKHNTPGPGPTAHWTRLAEKFELISRAEARSEQAFVEDAEVLVIAFGTAAKFVEYVVAELRADGHRVGWFRPVSLWPFPGEALEAAAANARTIAVFELNAGQMIDDVRLNVPNRRLVRSIGGISFDASGMNMGPLLDAPIIRQRILDVLRGDVPS
jgi:2-oxoglutarate ferredoxin oxidoreductase subunit alpha